MHPPLPCTWMISCKFNPDFLGGFFLKWPQWVVLPTSKLSRHNRHPKYQKYVGSLVAGSDWMKIFAAKMRHVSLGSKRQTTILAVYLLKRNFTLKNPPLNATCWTPPNCCKVSQDQLSNPPLQPPKEGTRLELSQLHKATPDKLDLDMWRLASESGKTIYLKMQM